ncbi:GNAT family N-acetyltransferase [Streptacidiphilus sp. ASG 303]|uniref:GNAT family N-acetyltransferase n=1 Tax=Streptacidiphilus sp. ASG 303 TaxID=2896847 RepID=UPI001E438EF6|nr:GNAT family N-acetyltransferase [Streptacidiphilus sp. ASG 303]MCD0484204.1 GNAT family N-acetyltransferase [Streptacidiphilus sp. ASG 303]
MPVPEQRPDPARPAAGDALPGVRPLGTLTGDPALTEGDVVLRRPRAEDADALVAGSRDPLVREFMQGVLPHPDRASAERWITGLAPRLWADGTAAHFALARPDGTAFGLAELVDLRPAEGAAEASFWLLPHARRMRTATAGLRLLCRFGFERLGLRRIDAYAAVDNMPVQVVGAAIGFRRAGFRPALFRSSRTHRLHDAVYATLSPDDLC